jgi:hypothetical protein
VKSENNGKYQVVFAEEFRHCLINMEEFFSEQGSEHLEWWLSKEKEIIIHIDRLLSMNPWVGRLVKKGSFKGLRRMI